MNAPHTRENREWKEKTADFTYFRSFPKNRQTVFPAEYYKLFVDRNMQ